MTAYSTLLRDILIPRVTRGRDGRVDHATALDMLAAILTIEPRDPDGYQDPQDHRDGQVSFQEDVLSAMHAVVGGAVYQRPEPTEKPSIMPHSANIIVFDGDGTVIAQHPSDHLGPVLRWCRFSIQMDTFPRPLMVLDLARAQTFTITGPDRFIMRAWHETASQEMAYPLRGEGSAP
ncbi:hypothetical protein ND748_03060 [Frankia sp. AiPs1]|uniref:hypothetical protein n=1 Tax=Frankia sp. AiPs1 TaxID=573493 RepID=UPI002042BFE5|nr:hypothetical protein [Frankia sp. AiPs1]MCM3920656.1 hypothetical protein [Frankia sp. AiPs1]